MTTIDVNTEAPQMSVPKLSVLRRYVPRSIMTTIGRESLRIQKNSPAILFGAGVVGVVATTVMACRATLKLEEVLHDLEKDLVDAKEVLKIHSDRYSASDFSRDRQYLRIRTGVKIGKLYGPSFVMGTLSIAALTGSHNMLNSRNLALTAAYAALDKGFRDYRGRVIDEYGEEKDREFRYSSEVVTLAEDTKNGPKTVSAVRVGPYGQSVYARFFDESCPDWVRNPEYNRLFLQCQQQYANNLLHARGHLFLNEVYDMLGMDRTKAGTVVGWVLTKDQGDNFVDFGIFNGDIEKVRDFVNGREGSILLDFNVDGVIYDKI